MTSFSIPGGSGEGKGDFGGAGKDHCEHLVVAVAYKIGYIVAIERQRVQALRLPLFLMIDSATTQENTFQYTEDPRGTTRLLTILLWVSLVIVVCRLVNQFLRLRLIKLSAIQIEEINTNLYRQDMLDEVTWAATFFTGIVFLLWIRYANLNCHGFGAIGMEYTPGWSIGWFFVPLANLFVPYFIMREIWKVSSSPVGWPLVKGDLLIAWWWILSLISGFGGFVDPTFTSGGDWIGVIWRATVFYIVVDTLKVPAFLIGLSLVKEISDRQEHLVQHGVPKPPDDD